MACTLDPLALTTAEALREYLDLPVGSDQDEAIRIWNDSTDGAWTEATVEVTKTAIALEVTGVGGTRVSIPLTGDMATLITTIEATQTGWNAVLLCASDVDASLLSLFNQRSVLLQANAAVLQHEDSCHLVRLVNIATDRIRNFASRELKASDHTEYFKVGNAGKIVVKNWPIIEVTRVAPGIRNVVEVRNSSADAAGSYALVTGTNLKLVVIGGVNAGTETVDLTDVIGDDSNQDTVGELVTELNTSTYTDLGWEAKILDANFANLPNADILPMGARPCLDAWIGLDAFAERQLAYTVDEESGIITLQEVTGRHFKRAWIEAFGILNDHLGNHPTFRINAPRVDYIVQYRGGYEVVPTEVEWWAHVIAQRLSHTQAFDPRVQSETLGDLSITYRSGTAGSAEVDVGLGGSMAHWANRWW